MMISEEISAKTYMDLANLEEHLNDMGLKTQLIERSEKYALNVLLALIEPDSKNRERVINFTFVPVGDDQLDYISLLQFYTNYSFDLNTNYRDDLVKALAVINTKLPFGCISVNENNQVFFRYVHVRQKFEVMDRDAIQELVALYQFAIDIFAPLIEDIATGAKNYEQAIVEIEQ
jgi:hypothetical protein